MAKLGELRSRTESIVRTGISPANYLVWSNEALEDLSEKAKLEGKPIKFDLDGTSYEYVITNDDTRYKRILSGVENGDYLYFDMNGDEIIEDWLVGEMTIGDELVVNGVTHTILHIDYDNKVIGAIASSDYVIDDTIVLDIVDVPNIPLNSSINIYDSGGSIKVENLIVTNVDTILDKLTVKFTKIYNGLELLATDYIDIRKNVYRRPFTDTDSYNWYDENGNSVSPIIYSDIKYVLKVDAHSIELPTNLQQVVKVEVNSNGYLRKIKKISFQDDINDFGEAYYEGGYPRQAIFSENIQGSVTIYYYKELPLYDIDDDIIHFEMLEVPFNESRFHNLINYYCIVKYSESWQDERSIEHIKIFTMKYEELKSELEEAVNRRHAKNVIPRQRNTKNWR